MKLIPILMSPPMVQATLDGLKTETRRILKIKGCKPYVPENPDEFTVQDILRWNKDYHPYGTTGDVLWVRETFYAYGKWDKKPGTNRKNGKPSWQFIDMTEESGQEYHYAENPPAEVKGWPEVKWGWYKRPSLFMPYNACRLFLRVENVHIDRLHYITEPAIKREGFTFGNNGHMHPLLWFTELWKKLNGEASWNDNPWVWVIQFSKTTKPTQP